MASAYLHAAHPRRRCAGDCASTFIRLRGHGTDLRQAFYSHLSSSTWRVCTTRSTRERAYLTEHRLAPAQRICLLPAYSRTPCRAWLRVPTQTRIAARARAVLVALPWRTTADQYRRWARRAVSICDISHRVSNTPSPPACTSNDTGVKQRISIITQSKTKLARASPSVTYRLCWRAGAGAEF